MIVIQNMKGIITDLSSFDYSMLQELVCIVVLWYSWKCLWGGQGKDSTSIYCFLLLVGGPLKDISHNRGHLTMALLHVFLLS